MPYWVKRILLKTGKIVTEREPRHDENLFDGPAPVVGDHLTVGRGGRTFEAKVIWGSWPGRNEAQDRSVTVPLRVEEI
jgi:hypothetical protein